MVHIYILLHHYIISTLMLVDTIHTRSHLPQHFNSTDLHFYAHDADTRQCDPEYRKAIKANQTTAIQTYNNVTEEALTSLCYQPKDGSCNYHQHKHTCIVDRTNTELRTVYKHLVENNSTKRLERYHESEANITGTILKWNIADIYDEPAWHHSNGDCSHFCYIPPLYEAAFERLELLLPELD